MRVGLFLKFDREVGKWSENREVPNLWGRVDRYGFEINNKANHKKILFAVLLPAHGNWPYPKKFIAILRKFFFLILVIFQ